VVEPAAGRGADVTMVRMIELAHRNATAAPALTPPIVGARPTVPETPRTVFDALVAIIAGASILGTTGAFPWRVLEEAVIDAAATLERSSDLFWMAVRGVDGDTALAAHHARVAVMALRLGANLKIDGDALIALGMAGCLFDLGLAGLPAAASLAPDRLPADHPRRAAELIRRWNPPYPDIIDAVAQHHARERGQGSIHLHARVLGLLDQYTRRAGGDVDHGPYDAVRDILKSRHDAFGADVIKALLAEVSVFPPGTVVRLSTGERARVIEPNRHQPLRPRVALLDEGRHLDLSETPFLYVRSAVVDG